MGLIRFFDIIHTNDNGDKAKVEFMTYNDKLFVLPMNLSWEQLEQSYKYAQKELAAGRVFPEEKKEKPKKKEKKRKNWFW